MSRPNTPQATDRGRKQFSGVHDEPRHSTSFSRIISNIRATVARKPPHENLQSLMKQLSDYLDKNPPSEKSYATVSTCIGHLNTEKQDVFEKVLLVLSSKNGAHWMKHLGNTDAQVCMDILDQVAAEAKLTGELFKAVLKVLTIICVRNQWLPPSCILAKKPEKIGDLAVDSGGCADVWRGRYQRKMVAIKAVRVYNEKDVSIIKRSFTREVIYWKYLRHPNITPFLGVNDSLFPFCMVSPWMKNGNVYKYLKDNPGANRLKLLGEVASGLAYLHSMGVVHGDLKSANILVDDEKHACLTDFGIAVLIRTITNRITVTSVTEAEAGAETTGGTCHMMAPELFNPKPFGRKDTRPTKRSDVYALSMVMVEFFTGRAPWGKFLDAQIVHKVTSGERPARPSAGENRGLSDDVWDLMKLCWDPDRMKRPDISFVHKRLGEAERAFVGNSASPSQ